MKKRYIFIVISLLFLATYTAFAGKASSYTISQNGISTEYSYTDWPALMAKVKTYNGTSSARVTVTITGNDFDEADKMPKVENYNTIVCANDNIPYTTFKFNNCTFAKSVYDQYDCLSFGYAIAPGIVLEFLGCTLNERLYGNEAGTAEGTHYTVDVKFHYCTFTSAATGGRHFGDLLFDGCRFTNRVSWDNTEPVINAQNGSDAGCRRVNSVGDFSKFTVRNCTFDQPITDASWLRFIYAKDFENHDIDIDYYFYPCLSDKFNFDKVSDYNTDKLNTGKVKKLELKNNAKTSSKLIFLAFLPARVKYEANAPESATASGVTKDDNLYEAGESFTVKTNGFTCNGYKFKGWNTLANPTEEVPGTAYTEGQVSQIPLTIGFKLYAQWETLATLIVSCTGLTKNDAAIFKVMSGDNEVCTLSVSAEHPKKAVIGLDAGLYTVIAQDWSWSYEIDKESLTKEIHAITAATSEADNTFPFALEKTSDIPKHAESLKKNDFSRQIVPVVDVQPYNKKPVIHVKF